MNTCGQSHGPDSEGTVVLSGRDEPIESSVIITQTARTECFSVENTFVPILDPEFIHCLFRQYLSVTVVAVSFHVSSWDTTTMIYHSPHETIPQL